MSLDLGSKYKKREDLVSKKIGSEYILVPLVDNIASMDKVYTLNEVGAYIWEQFDGEKTLFEIVKNVTLEFDVDEQTAATDIEEFIKKIDNIIIN